jgi:hypothetical protein
MTICASRSVKKIFPLISETSFEAFNVAVLPGTAGLNVGGLCFDWCDPFPNGFGGELGAIIGANVARHATKDERMLDEKALGVAVAYSVG